MSPILKIERVMAIYVHQHQHEAKISISPNFQISKYRSILEIGIQNFACDLKIYNNVSIAT